MNTEIVLWILGVAVMALGGLLAWVKASYDRRLERFEDRLTRAEGDAHGTHTAMMGQTQLVSERVTRLEGQISTSLTEIDRRLTRMEGTLDAMMRAGFVRPRGADE